MTTATAPPGHRLAVLLPNLDGGGAERSLLRVAGGLSATAPVQLILGRRRGALERELPDGVDVVDLGVDRLRGAVAPLRRHLERYRPSVLLTSLPHAIVVGALAIRWADVPTVLIPRIANTPSAARARPWTVPGLVDLAALQVVRRARTVIAVSDGVATDLVASGVQPAAVQTLPNPVVDRRLLEGRTRRPRHRYFRDGGGPVVLGMGRLEPQKDFATLVRAFAIVRQHVPARLLILGEGSERGELEQLSRELGVSADVDLPGFVDEPYAMLASCGVFVLSSRFEGLPGALIQAVACGARVVATDCPSGPRQILADGRHGTLVSVGDVGALAAAVLGTLRDRTPPPGMEAVAQYGEDRAVAAYAAVIDRARRDGRPAAAVKA